MAEVSRWGSPGESDGRDNRMTHIKVTDEETEQVLSCADCGAQLDKVPDERTARLRVGDYKHDCQSVICYGAGTTGRFIIRKRHKEGLPLPVLVDSDKSKWGVVMEGVEVMSPGAARAKYPDAVWTASVVHPPLREEILKILADMGVKTIEVWRFLPERYGLPPDSADSVLRQLVADGKSYLELLDQEEFRAHPNYSTQRPPSDIRNIYFEDFFTHLDDEHFVDCGAADGDTVREFLKRWEKWAWITVFEPDPDNFRKIAKGERLGNNIQPLRCAVSDINEARQFVNTGDYSAHLGKSEADVQCITLDDFEFALPPTFIKMDIEGSELEALWGARRVLKEHRPVLAICTYHEASHLWEVPLLAHALQPDYKIFIRRYAQGTFETVCYCVPPERLK